MDNPDDQQDVEGEWAPFAARSGPIIVSVPAIVDRSSGGKHGDQDRHDPQADECRQ